MSTMNKWSYGTAWEHFPIEEGQIWGTENPVNLVTVHDILNTLPVFMFNADLLFIDPPWNGGNLNSFYTKAFISGYQEYGIFVDALFGHIADINPRTCYLEIGKENVDLFCDLLPFKFKQRWQVTYYRKYPCWIIRGSKMRPIEYDFTGIDEAECIKTIAEIEQYGVIGDLCMGRGSVGLAANKAKKQFVGTELNKRRLACLLDKLEHVGADIIRYV